MLVRLQHNAKLLRKQILKVSCKTVKSAKGNMEHPTRNTKEGKSPQTRLEKLLRILHSLNRKLVGKYLCTI